MKENIIVDSMGRESRYGMPHENARFWYWKDDIGNKGYLRAITEMEALDRLDEASPQRGALVWISQKDYKKL